MARLWPTANPSPLQRVHTRWSIHAGIELWLKRDELLHPHISGNKWRKLLPNIEIAFRKGYRQLLTFGGAYSNHLAAVAAAGRILGFRTIGIVRGERIEPLNPTLSFAERQGMFLLFVSRRAYQLYKHPDYWPEWKRRFGHVYILPEGGSNWAAVNSCRQIAQEVHALGIKPDHWCVAAGTGATAAGLIRGRHSGQVHVIAVLKGHFLRSIIEQWVDKTGKEWQLHTNFHHGGIAKWTPQLLEFITDFWQQTGIRLDPIYTGKMMWGTYQLAQNGVMARGTTVVAVHTGGLQGIKGFNQRFGQHLP